jgi:hypothetical protein
MSNDVAMAVLATHVARANLDEDQLGGGRKRQRAMMDEVNTDVPFYPSTTTTAPVPQLHCSDTTFPQPMLSATGPIPAS